MIGLDKVTAGYGPRAVLEGVSFALAPKGITVLTGPSGEGKTTALRLLAGLMLPTVGQVLPGKQPAILFQEDRLFPWRTVAQHLTDILPPERWGEVPLWLALADLTGEEGVYPAALSGGMARRLALVRAMALGGDCLLLDEPFTGVDADRRDIFLECLAQWPVPVLLITHDSYEIQQGRHLVKLGG